MTRSFSQADWNAAQRAWADGDFSDEWKTFRHEAAMRGILYPPEGTSWDSWGDAIPSPRAMLIRAIRETPTLLHIAISRSKSWSEVLTYILARRDQWREELDAAAREDARRRMDEEPQDREAAMALKTILTRISDS